MKRIAIFILSLCLLTGCAQQSAAPSAPETPPAAQPSSVEAAPGAAEAVEDTVDIEIILPEEYLPQLIVTTDFPDADPEGHQVPLMWVQERASVEAEERETGYTGGGFLFGFARMDQAGLEEHLLTDYGGVQVFARKGDTYYAMTRATDVQFYRSDGIIDTASADWANWEMLKALGPKVCEDIIRRNGLEPYTTDAYYQEPFTYEGDHAYVYFYPYMAFDGSKAERWTLLLSQPVRQGEGGIWCVERWCDEVGWFYLNFPGNGVAAADYYAALQAECDAGRHPELLTPLGAALACVQDFHWSSGEVVDTSVELADGLDTDYAEANQLMSQTIADLLVRPESVSDEDLLFCVGTFQKDTWGVMGRRFYGSDWWTPLQAALRSAATGDDQMNRDRNMMRFYLTSYGRYADFLSDLLQTQRSADPDTFAQVLGEFSAEEQAHLESALADTKTP